MTNFEVSEDIIEALKTAGPEPIVAGSFAVFGKPNGNAVIVLHVTGQDDDIKQEIPASILKMVLSAAGGKGPLAHLGGLF